MLGGRGGEGGGMMPLIKKLLIVWCIFAVGFLIVFTWATTKMVLRHHGGGGSKSSAAAQRRDENNVYQALSQKGVQNSNANHRTKPWTTKEIIPVDLRTLVDKDTLWDRLNMVSQPPPHLALSGDNNNDGDMLEFKERIGEDAEIEVQQYKYSIPNFMFFMHIPKTAGFTFNNIFINYVFNEARKDDFKKPMRERWRSCNIYCGCNEGYRMILPPPSVTSFPVIYVFYNFFLPSLSFPVFRPSSAISFVSFLFLLLSFPVFPFSSAFSSAFSFSFLLSNLSNFK